MAKRRANGEGSLRKRKDGRWEGRYTAGTDPVTGKAIIKNVLGKTQAEVKEKLKKAIAESENLDTDFTEYNDVLVRRLVEVIKIMPDKTMEVVLKSGMRYIFT